VHPRRTGLPVAAQAALGEQPGHRLRSRAGQRPQRAQRHQHPGQPPGDRRRRAGRQQRDHLGVAEAGDVVQQPVGQPRAPGPAQHAVDPAAHGRRPGQHQPAQGVVGHREPDRRGERAALQQRVVQRCRHPVEVAADHGQEERGVPVDGISGVEPGVHRREHGRREGAGGCGQRAGAGREGQRGAAVDEGDGLVDGLREGRRGHASGAGAFRMLMPRR
jgi:hypothetical protein